MSLDQFRVDGKVAVITGAGSGIGRASAVALSEAGASVVLADVDKAGLDETASVIGGAVTVVPTDVSREREVDALVAAAVAEYGRLDVMANIAGIMLRRSIAEMSEAELDTVLSVNLKGVFFGVRAALKAMAESGGSIVNMASSAIDMPAEGIAAYAMSKAAVASLTKAAAREGGRAGIRVNAIAPGYVSTPMTESDEGVGSRTTASFMQKMSPINAVGQPEDIANAVLYLASDASRFVTGQTLRPNGGVTMPW